jgi:acetylornithine aminotransferase/acetylornithine/N-succinyldiaminopimelate aminotransferase
VRVWDDQGRGFIDFVQGIATNTLGHCHPYWVEQVQAQAQTLTHTSNLFRNEKQGLLAEALVRRAGPGRVFFCNSGAEANEGLIKLARLHGRALSAGQEAVRHKIVCAHNAFHGRTFGGMSATPQEKIQNGFRPMLDGFEFGEFNDLASFDKLIDERTAAVFVETIQGESGILPASTEFLQGLRRLCDERGALLMLDEVQCGIGRTGRFYAFEHHGVRPDAIGMAKGLGGGFPIGAMWIGEKHAGLFKPGSHGTTFGGTPLACSASLAVLDTIEREGLLDNVATLSVELHARLKAIAAKYPTHFTGVRGLGFHVALVAKDNAAVVTKLRENGLLAALGGNGAVRLLPPLNLTRAELIEALDIVEASAGQLS